jgi:hypothetical protein
MIVQITCAKVGHRQAPFKQKPDRKVGLFVLRTAPTFDERGRPIIKPNVLKSRHVAPGLTGRAAANVAAPFGDSMGSAPDVVRNSDKAR